MRVIMESADTAGQEKLAEALQACGVAILECSDELAEGVTPVSVEKRLCFDFEKVSKHEVMMTFLEMYERGLITGTKDALQTFLAVYSNLGTKESVHKLYVRCLNEYRKDKDHQGSTVFIYAPGSQYVDKQFILGKPLPDPPCVGREKGPSNLPEVLATPEAMALWKKAQAAGYVDEHYQPLHSRTQAALLADYMAERLGIREKWKVFEMLWNRKNMYRDYYKALNLQQSLAFQDEIKKLFC